jgi:hypothetical protein
MRTKEAMEEGWEGVERDKRALDHCRMVAIGVSGCVGGWSARVRACLAGFPRYSLLRGEEYVVPVVPQAKCTCWGTLGPQRISQN